jgi:phospholipase C
MGKGTGKGVGGGNPIEHIVVLMLENRAFDHMCGFLKRLNPTIDGLTGSESNPINPANPSQGTVKVSDDAPYVTTPDPSHSVPGTSRATRAVVVVVVVAVAVVVVVQVSIDY